jgi:hypothetical protein
MMFEDRGRNIHRSRKLMQGIGSRQDVPRQQDHEIGRHGQYPRALQCGCTEGTQVLARLRSIYPLCK